MHTGDIMSNSAEFDRILEESFNRFRDDSGGWREIVIGPNETIIGYYIYMLRNFFDKYAENIFKLPERFKTLLTAGNGITLLGADKTDVFPSLKMGFPSGRFQKMELGEASVTADINYVTHDRWVGTIYFISRGRNAMECIQLSDMLIDTLKGPLLNTQRVFSIYPGSIQTTEPTEKKISNDIVAWESRLTMNIEIISMGTIFEVMVPVLQDIQVVMK